MELVKEPTVYSAALIVLGYPIPESKVNDQFKNEELDQAMRELILNWGQPKQIEGV